MILTGLVRIGNEPALRYTPSNDPVIDLNLAYPFGKQDATGKRPTQWISATLWGKRAESLAPYLLKGKQYFVVLSDVYLNQYKKKDGTDGVSIRARVDSIEFTDRKDHAETAQPAPRQAKPDFNDIDDDMPF